MFIPAYFFKTDKLTDLSYAISFIVLILISFFSNSFTISKLILLAMVIFWSLRLGIFLFIRIRKMKKDSRFDDMRDKLFRFLGFWILQGVSVFIILIPSLFFLDLNKTRACYLGLGIWFIGLIIEATADIQKYKFKLDKKNKDKFIDIGIWKYSRHPNYFGEILCWVGVYVFVFLSFSISEKLIALIGPLFITTLLLFVSGIPLLEKYADKKWGKDKEYQEYKKNTNILIPWFKKEN
jgi:steroid 5-alpha reductase family enzyme